MLGKLIKYDLKANRNVFLLMYAVILCVAVGTRFSFVDWMAEFNQAAAEESVLSSVVSSMLIFTYWMAVVTLNVLCIVLIVRRFYTNLFGGEGYLTFTLPVSVEQIYFSKVISSVILYVSAALVQLLSVLIMVVGTVDQESWIEIEYYVDLIGDSLINSGDAIAQTVIGVFELLAGLLMIYFAICVGQMVNRHRVISAVAVYFGMNTIFNTVETFIAEAFIDYNDFMSAISYSDAYYVCTILFLVIRLALFAWGSILIMKKKLNLE